MTEFETASLAVREWTLWVTASMQALAVGAILFGMWQMRRAGDQRENSLGDTMNAESTAVTAEAGAVALD